MVKFQPHMWLSAASVALSLSIVAGQNIGSTVPSWPVHDNGLNKVVTWDHYSFMVNGRRLFLFSGELHYWRIPVPELWVDILEKIKASGFTAVAFYSHWGYHSPNPQTVDITTGARDFTKLLEIAKRVGLYVIVRPGPYVNAETNAGGFPGWLTTGAYGKLRDNNTAYTDAWKPFFAEYSKAVSKHQVTNGGNTLVYQLENEYGSQWIGNALDKVPNPVAIQYMEALQKSARENGIDVPVIHNDPNLNTKSWSKDFAPGVGGNVDVYGVDSYPSCWSCNLAECTGTNGQYMPYKVINYHDTFQLVAPTQPEFMPEFQGGSYNPWGGPEGGCPNDIGAEFANLFYRDNIAQRITAISLYMMYGGTNWGSMACPIVGTSYDYSSPITEGRGIWSKFYETKNLALFTRVAQDLTVTERIGNSSSYSSNPAVQATELRNPEKNSAFYVTRHTNSSSGTREEFKLRISTSEGNFTVPQKIPSIVLNGHQSKIVVADFAFGSHRLVYSTAEVLSYAIIDKKPVLALWVPTGESGEFYIKGAKKGATSRAQGFSNVGFAADAGGLLVTFTQGAGSTVLMIDEDIRVLILDRTFAYTTWVPVLSDDPFGLPEDTVIIQGPYLVRSASIDAKSILDIKGDQDKSSLIEIFASASVKSVTWNGQPLRITRTKYGSIQAQLSGPKNTKISLPPLTKWKSEDSLPERLPNYDDSGIAWVQANHSTTPNPRKPDTLPVLYIDDYEFHNGNHLWRGSFTGIATGVSLSVQGGQAFGWSAWLNGVFIGSYLGTPSSATGNLTLSFANATVHVSSTQKNTLLILQDNNGHDLRDGAITPRGILSVRLQGSNSTTFSSWRVAGAAGGASDILDPMRGIYNEGGLAAERLGWHLPGFNDNSWRDTTSSPSKGLSSSGVRFFRTVVPLNIPHGLDVSLSLILSTPTSSSTKYRAMLFVNGYQYGRFNPWIGNQKDFPIPPGVLNYRGDNTIGVSIWAQSEEGGAVDIAWKVNYVLDSAFNPSFKGDYLRPNWGKERLKYV